MKLLTSLQLILEKQLWMLSEVYREDCVSKAVCGLNIDIRCIDSTPLMEWTVKASLILLIPLHTHSLDIIIPMDFDHFQASVIC